MFRSSDMQAVLDGVKWQGGMLGCRREGVTRSDQMRSPPLTLLVCQGAPTSTKTLPEISEFAATANASLTSSMRIT